MARKRVVGEIGDDLTVMTEWFDDPADGVMTGVEIGLKARGWQDTEIEVYHG